MSISRSRPAEDDGFRQIIDTVSQQGQQPPQKPQPEKPAVAFTSSASAFRYFGHLMSGR